MPRPVRSSPLAALGGLLALLALSSLASSVEVRPVPTETSSPRPHVVASGPVDLNHASARELEALPRIGPALAARIVARREQRPFATIEELDEVPGVGPAVIAALRGRVTVSSPTRDGDALPSGPAAR